MRRKRGSIGGLSQARLVPNVLASIATKEGREERLKQKTNIIMSMEENILKNLEFLVSVQILRAATVDL